VLDCPLQHINGHGSWLLRNASRGEVSRRIASSKPRLDVIPGCSLRRVAQRSSRRHPTTLGWCPCDRPCRAACPVRRAV